MTIFNQGLSQDSQQKNVHLDSKFEQMKIEVIKKHRSEEIV